MKMLLQLNVGIDRHCHLRQHIELNKRPAISALPMKWTSCACIRRLPLHRAVCRQRRHHPAAAAEVSSTSWKTSASASTSTTPSQYYPSNTSAHRLRRGTKTTTSKLRCSGRRRDRAGLRLGKTARAQLSSISGASARHRTAQATPNTTTSRSGICRSSTLRGRCRPCRRQHDRPVPSTPTA